MVLLKEQYGKQVVVNLLGSRGGEEVLNRAFKVTGSPPWGEAERWGGGACSGWASLGTGDSGLLAPSLKRLFSIRASALSDLGS